MTFGIIGSGSWATALVKVITDKKQPVNWWVRNTKTIEYIKKRHHNPHYLSSAVFDTSLLNMSEDIKEVIGNSEVLVIAVPSAYLESCLSGLNESDLKGKKILSATKGILPGKNLLLNEYLLQNFQVPLESYFALLGPCHAEEVAAEKLSYLTFSGVDIVTASTIASAFTSDNINTVVNHDILGVQYAAVLKNIYALGAGIAHGLDYGDNFLSVYIANAADEMAGFLKKFGAIDIVVGDHGSEVDPYTLRKTPNYAASVYLGDLLVTCYSPYSRNRSFGNMIGKGYSVKAAQLEMNMVAEGYNASKCIYQINTPPLVVMPLAASIYRILWESLKPADGFKQIEQVMV